MVRLQLVVAGCLNILVWPAMYQWVTTLPWQSQLCAGAQKGNHKRSLATTATA